MPSVIDRLHDAGTASADAVTRVTGVRPSGYVARLMAEDLAAYGRYLTDPSARRAERSDGARASTTEECFAFSRSYFGVGPVQHFAEINGVLELAEENGTRVVCEIGTRDAGTSVLFSRVLRPESLIVMDLYAKNRWRLRHAAPSGQAVHVIDGDSTHPRTVARLRRKLLGTQIDLLLIDGDHGWAGVRHDFLNYHGFVRDGGLIAFHDICPVRDPTVLATTGDVPAFWKLVRELYPSFEFIETPDQQGLGIGVIRFDPTVPVAAVLEAVAPPPDPNGHR